MYKIRTTEEIEKMHVVNIKYELALVELSELGDRPLNMEMTRYKWRLERVLKEKTALNELVNAIYKEDDG